MRSPKQNQVYYLRQKTADRNKEAWFRYVRSMKQYSESVLVTPEMAQELLKTQANEITLRKFRSVVPDEVFRITLSLSGRLLDGKYRLESIVTEEKSKEVMVTFNVLDKLDVLFQ